MTSASDFLAFYLPQYHPTPENDAFWGPGFTEWRHVATARPLYPGHYQPHVPADLGFYDLRLASVRRQQADLAAASGIDAFCFYHYWFEGRRLLEGPVDAFFEDAPTAVKYLLCWVNESWTLAWHGQDEHTTIAQTYDARDDIAHAEHLVRYLTDERYYRIDGRPLLIVYHPDDLPDPAATIARWREVFAAHGCDPLLASCSVFAEVDPRPWGLDFMIRWNPNWLRIRESVDERLTRLLRVESRLLQRVDPRFRHNEAYSYEAYAQRESDSLRPAWPTAETVFPSWDNSPRRARGDAVLFSGSSPERFEAWLRATVARRRPDDPAVVFINAWNEWAESCHLEPDLRWGHAWLDVVREVARTSR